MSLHGPIFLVLLATAARADPIWFEDFETSDGQFTASGDLDQWTWGASTSSPSACHSGRLCWVTVLDGNYYNESIEYLRLPPVDVGALEDPLLAFYHWYSVEPGDTATVEADFGEGWQRIEPIYGYPSGNAFVGDSGGWNQVFFDLRGMSWLTQVRLVFRANERASAPGWAIDDFAVYDSDVVPPRISGVSVLPDTENLEGPYVVTASVEDDGDLESVRLRYVVDGGPQREVPMTSVGGSRFEGALPAQAPGSKVWYQVFASDGQNEVLAPDEGESFMVRLLPPDGLVAEGIRVWGTHVDLSWRAPDSVHELQGYRVQRNGRTVLECAQPSAEAPILDGEQVFTVTALYDVGASAPSEITSVQGAVPAILTLEPGSAFQGDLIRLMLRGRNLLLTPDTVEFSLGEGVEMRTLDVRNADSARLELRVDDEAAPGVRMARLVTGGVEVLETLSFEVLDGDGRPRLLSVEPDRVHQGDTADLTLVASHAFANAPRLSLGSDILIEEVESLDASTLRVRVVVPWSAALGEHPLELDDGVRLYSGLAVDVLDRSFDYGDCGCAAAPGRRASGLLGLGLAFLIGRARRTWALPPLSAGAKKT